MKFLLLLSVGVLTVFASELIEEFTVGNNQLTADLYKQLLTSNSGNILVCPFSAETILALTYTGARGQTAKQLASGLRLPDSPEKVQQIFTEINDHLKQFSSNSAHSSPYKLDTANKVYVQHNFSINPQFKETAVKAFDANIQTIDFSENQAAANEINGWVAEKTQNHIKDLLSPSDLSATTRAVLVNALFFQAVWYHKFSESATAKKPFYLNANDQINVEMMSTTRTFDYYECSELNAQIVELPYYGDASMVIVLPKEKEGLSHVEKNLDKVFTPHEYNATSVTLSIPKFKVETTVPLVPVLQALGVNDAFYNADFSGLGEGPLKIDQVIQKNYVEIDEKGTTAASATAVVAGLASAMYPPLPRAVFVADHPFIYYIKKQNVVLFAGSIKQF